MRVRAVLLAAALILVPLGTRAADLVVWWEEGAVPGEDRAVREIIAAFESKAGKSVEVTFPPHAIPQAPKGLPAGVLAALDAGRPPDFLYQHETWNIYHEWAREGRLVDLADTLGPLAAQFDKDALAQATLLDGATGRRGLYALPMAHATEHIHAWKSLLERTGLTLADIPRSWEPFWSFWCDKVQPAVRKVTSRDDV